ncbi:MULTISPECIES: hypothetical protein [Tepidibacillus]|uniref:hypothetical protein n=1 Tax=Tepidibacillus TaxID=1494427 RepID=UPI00128F2368|nr:hypothetical protein [Tepidibacillus decaturensis]
MNMYQVKILQANQNDILEELINMWLREQTEVNVVDIKFQSHSLSTGMTEYVAVMVYEVQA